MSTKTPVLPYVFRQSRMLDWGAVSVRHRIVWRPANDMIYRVKVRENQGLSAATGNNNNIEWAAHVIFPYVSLSSIAISLRNMSSLSFPHFSVLLGLLML